MYPEWRSKDKAVRARGAEKYVERIKQDFSDEIDYSINNSMIYDWKNTTESEPHNTIKFFLADGSTQRALEVLKQQLGDIKICALNFASYKNPGGRFIDGSKAQEEALCASSTLYPVLESFVESYYDPNRKDLNKGIYRDKAIYSRDILFHDYERNHSFTADILTCAAPNYSVALKYGGFTAQENEEALVRRVRFLYRIVALESVDTLILGAWGCGVFKQDPKIVSRIMVTLAGKMKPARNIVFAIPSSVYDSTNYNAFREALHRWEPGFIVI